MTALIVALVVSVAMVLEISRSNANLQASIKTVDARKAREAADFGLQEILDRLNDNENHYLLVTRLSNPSGTGDWQSATSGNLVSCNIQLPSTAPSANRIAGVSTNSISTSVALPSDPTVSYSLVSYEPPTEAGASAAGCSMFGNRLGGRARLTVRGIVKRNGVTLASYDSTRDVYIRTETLAQQSSATLVITGSPGSSHLGGPFHIVSDVNNDGMIGMTGSNISETFGDVYCIRCTSPSDLDQGSASFGNVITGPIADFPAFPSIPPELTSVAPVDIKTVRTNYPFLGSGNSGPLEPECRYLTEGGVPNAAIGCRIQHFNIGGSNYVIVRVDGPPVKLFVSGVYKLSGSGYTTISDGNPATPAAQDRTQYWHKLRVYGLPGIPDATNSQCTQEVTMSGGSVSNAAFLWFPFGKVKISGGTIGSVDYYGALWTCVFNNGSGNAGLLMPTNVVVPAFGAGGAGGAGAYLYRATGTS